MVVFCSHGSAVAQDIVMTGLTTSNRSTAVEGDSSGEFYDWIELYKPGPPSVNLSGWHLTDGAGIPFFLGGAFSSTTIPAKS